MNAIYNMQPNALKAV